MHILCYTMNSTNMKVKIQWLKNLIL